MKITFDNGTEALTFYNEVVLLIWKASGALAGLPALAKPLDEAAHQLAPFYFEWFLQHQAAIAGTTPTTPPAPAAAAEKQPEGGTPVVTLSTLQVKANIHKALKKAGIASPQQLAACTPASLRVRCGLTPGAVEEVKFALAEHGLRLAEPGVET